MIRIFEGKSWAGMGIRSVRLGSGASVLTVRTDRAIRPAPKGQEGVEDIHGPELEEKQR